MNLKTTLKPTFKLLALSLALSASTLWAQDWTQYNSEPGASKVQIEGKSSLGKWDLEGQLIGGRLETAPGIQLDSKGQSALAGKSDFLKAEVMIPVTSLKSGKAPMDEVVQQAMNAPQHPRIRYSLKKITLDKNAEPSGEKIALESSGDLTINGVTKAIVMPVQVTSLEGGKIKISGKTELNMTEYEVKPPAPKLALGFINTAEEVTISFDWIVKKR